MTRIEYDLMQGNYPELNFPDWAILSRYQSEHVKKKTVKTVVQMRRQSLLIGNGDWTDVRYTVWDAAMEGRLR